MISNKSWFEISTTSGFKDN